MKGKINHTDKNSFASNPMQPFHFQWPHSQNRAFCKRSQCLNPITAKPHKGMSRYEPFTHRLPRPSRMHDTNLGNAACLNASTEHFLPNTSRFIRKMAIKLI